MKTIAFKTFGCKANSTDTDALYLAAQRYGFRVVTESESADAYVINTCTVTAHADRDARLQALRFKRQNPNARVGVIGCYAQVAKDELLALDEVDVVLGTADKFRVLEQLELAIRSETPISRDQVSESKGFLPTDFEGSRYARATLKIQDGCNFKCSFCIIPTARGRSRSLPTATVLQQIRTAQQHGFNEVVITGIHLAHYGWDLGSDLEELLRLALAIDNGPRIRLSTLDPFEIPDSLLDLVMAHPRFCPHFHIALQSGSDEVLKAMRRLYRAEEFFAVNEKIAARNPNTFIGVDVIVGFPGETEAQFQQTLELLKRSFWSKLHVFPYSVREGTTAAALNDKVPPAVIHARAEQLREISEERYQRFLRCQIGRKVKVILEKKARNSVNVWQGHSENYLPTLTEFSEGQTKQIVECVIRRVEGDKVWAERDISPPFQLTAKN